MRTKYTGLVLVGIAIWIFGVFLYEHFRAERVRGKIAVEKRELLDLNSPPVFNGRMSSPDWTIREWLEVGEDTGDCSTADELLSQRLLKPDPTRAGRRGRLVESNYTTKDFVESCMGEPRSKIEFITPHVRKWCAFRTSHQRAEVLCSEWERNERRYMKFFQDRSDAVARKYAEVSHLLQ